MKTDPLGRRAREFAGAATYRIVVEGRLDASRLQGLGDLSVANEASVDGLPRVSLVGPFQDQAELSGLLDTLQATNVSLVSVERSPERESDEVETERRRRPPGKQ